MSAAVNKQLRAVGDDLWKTRTDKISAELFILTYGSLVQQLIEDAENYSEVNRQLERM